METTTTTKHLIKKMSDEQLDAFILKRLQFTKDHVYTRHDDEHPEGRSKHLRFDMSGYGDNNSCAIHNNKILQLFADCGIYNKVTFLHLDTYKGNVTLYWLWWKYSQNPDHTRSRDYTTLGTREIIKSILKNFAIADYESQYERRM